MIGPVLPPAAASSQACASGARQAFEHLLLAPPEQFGQNPVHHHGSQIDTRLAPQPGGQLQRLAHRHLGRGGHDHQAGRGGVVQDVEHPSRLLAHQADLHQLVDGLRGGQLADDVAAGRSVNHDQCRSAAPRTSQHSFPTVTISLTPGAADATKSNILANGPMRATSGSFS